jgi:glycosyltransferase involved in cell wall biosynthesis
MFDSTSEINTFLLHSNYYNQSHSYYNHLYLSPNQSQAECIYFYKNEETVNTPSNGNIEYSVVIPIHNQETIIVNNVLSVLTYTSGIFELILILDGCTDNTKINLLNFFNSSNLSFFKCCKKIIIIQQQTSIFEAGCDNMGSLLASGNYIVEIQADMTMCQYGYNSALSLPFKLLDNIIGVSGRMCHAWNVFSAYFGKIGETVNSPLRINHNDYNTFFSTNTCNRGPLVLDKQKLKECNYLDEKNYFLESSDHDLFLRATTYKNWICGHIPIEFISPVSLGSTRKERSPEEKELYNHRISIGNKGFYNSINYKQSKPLERINLLELIKNKLNN